MALQKGQRCFVGEVYGDFWVDLSLQLHELPDPVARQESEVWETLVNCTSAGIHHNSVRNDRF